MHGGRGERDEKGPAIKQKELGVLPTEGEKMISVSFISLRYMSQWMGMHTNKEELKERS